MAQELDKFTKIHQKFLHNEISVQDFSRFVLNVAKRHEVDIKGLFQLQQYVTSASLFAAVDFEQLFDEMEQANHAMRIKLALSPDEQALIMHWRDLTWLKHLALVNANRTMVEYFMEHRHRFRLMTFLKFIKPLSTQYHIRYSLVWTLIPSQYKDHHRLLIFSYAPLTPPFFYLLFTIRFP